MAFADFLLFLDPPKLAKLGVRLNVITKENKLVVRHTGQVVGLGDGINDGPSLHSADVGISVANALEGSCASRFWRGTRRDRQYFFFAFIFL